MSGDDDETRPFFPRGVCGDGHLHGDDGEGQSFGLQVAPEGEPLQPGEEFVQVAGRGSDGSLRLRTLYKHHGGPARVTSQRYRDGFDAVFGKSKKRGAPN